MNSGYRNIIFFFICFFLIFNNVPKAIQMNFIGGPVGNKLVLYPLLVGFVYTVWCQWHCGGVFARIGCFGKYCAIYLGTALVSLLLGLYTYPYWDLVLAGPVDQIEKLPKMMALLHSYGIEADSRVLMSIWIVVRQIKGLLLEMFWCLGGAYMVYCWYKDDWHQGMKIGTYALVASLAVFIGYGMIDALYLYGNITAKEILMAVNPYLHPILTNNGWWPPLLWTNQLRSVFAEPSHVGNYLGVAFPFLLYWYFKSKNKIFLAIVSVVVFLVVLTNARTAYAMMGGMLCLSGMLVLLWARALWKQIIAVFIAAVIGFSGGVVFFNSSSGTEVTAESLVEDNIGSLASAEKRSNGTRYALIKCNLRIAAQNPIFGVGNGLGQAYMIENYTENERQNSEVAEWISRAQKYGFFASGQGFGDAMNEFVTRLSNRGAVGLVVFLIPFLYLMYRVCRYKKRDADIERLTVVLAVVSCLVAGCNGSINLIYGYWILLGLGYAMCLGSEESVDDVNDERA